MYPSGTAVLVLVGADDVPETIATVDDPTCSKVLLAVAEAAVPPALLGAGLVDAIDPCLLCRRCNCSAKLPARRHRSSPKDSACLPRWPSSCPTASKPRIPEGNAGLVLKTGRVTAATSRTAGCCRSVGGRSREAEAEAAAAERAAKVAVAVIAHSESGDRVRLDLVRFMRGGGGGGTGSGAGERERRHGGKSWMIGFAGHQGADSAGVRGGRSGPQCSPD